MDLDYYSFNSQNDFQTYQTSSPYQFCITSKAKGKFISKNQIFLYNVERNLSILIVSLAILFFVPIIYVLSKRNTPAMKSRSPKLLILCFAFLGIHSISSAINYSLNDSKNHKFLCKQGLINTGLWFSGAMVFYIIRMYRIFKFYNLYEMSLRLKANLKQGDFDKLRESIAESKS
jgi:hypothetical protein